MKIYRDGNDNIKPHRDAIESFGEYPVIANLSIGSERIIRFENKKVKSRFFDFGKGKTAMITVGEFVEEQTYILFTKEARKVFFEIVDKPLVEISTKPKKKK